MHFELSPMAAVKSKLHRQFIEVVAESPATWPDQFRNTQSAAQFIQPLSHHVINETTPSTP